MSHLTNISGFPLYGSFYRTVPRPSYLHNVNAYTGKAAFLYRDGLSLCEVIGIHMNNENLIAGFPIFKCVTEIWQGRLSASIVSQVMAVGRHGLFSLGMFSNHDDVIKWEHFPHYWPFVRGIHRSPVNSPEKGQWRGALMFSLIWAWVNDWINNRKADDLRPHRAHYDVTVMLAAESISKRLFAWKLGSFVDLAYISMAK